MEVEGDFSVTKNPIVQSLEPEGRTPGQARQNQSSHIVRFDPESVKSGMGGESSLKKSMSMQDLMKSKSRLSSPRGGNIYLSNTIVDELETGQKSQKSRKASYGEKQENSQLVGRLSHFNLRNSGRMKSPIQGSDFSQSFLVLNSELNPINELANEESQKKEKYANSQNSRVSDFASKSGESLFEFDLLKPPQMQTVKDFETGIVSVDKKIRKDISFSLVDGLYEDSTGDQAGKKMSK
jgi:hypothetical protein